MLQSFLSSQGLDIVDLVKSAFPQVDTYLEKITYLFNSLWS